MTAPAPDPLDARATRLLIDGEVRAHVDVGLRTFDHPLLEHPIALDFPEGVVFHDRGQGYRFLDYVRGELVKLLRTGEIS